MSNTKHATIINFYGYSLTDFEGNSNVTLIMELSRKGSTADQLKKVQQGLSDHQYNNTAQQKILIRIARGMMHLHEHHIIHRDLWPHNILLDDNFEPHITGFSKFNKN